MMESYVVELADEDATRQLGASLAARFQNEAALILLSGNLGAGKTTLAQGFINTLTSLPQPIASPSYSYCNIYETKPKTYHFDLYRLENPEEITNLGLKEPLFNNEALRLVEWPERLPELTLFATAIVYLEATVPRKARVTYFS
jgi:tRNA threonylcarbamoyl adenosine modification protein YjeE